MIALPQLLMNIVDDVPAIEIRELAFDSRRVATGDLFIALNGLRSRGHDYIPQVLAAGAAAVVYDAAVEVSIDTEVPLIAVPDLAQKAGMIAARRYGQPSQAQYVVGVTGTNGKTSCSQFIAQALHSAAAPAAVIGTLGNGVWGHLAAATHTTPDALSVQRLLAELKAAGADQVAMEVSSHALDQGRVIGVAFDAVVFTNLSHDHLDYHGTMAAYGAAKARLFTEFDAAAAVINADDGFGRELLNLVPATSQLWAYGLNEMQPLPARTQRVWGQLLRCDHAGLLLQVTTPQGVGRIEASLLGRFNASNLLAVLCVLLAKGVALDEACARLSRLTTVPGRMERFGGDGKRPLVVVDYAHTPDALEQALLALRDHCHGLLWCVFGCGGDRDREKRPVMGRIAERFADRVVVTDDNPRNELSANIISAIIDGMQQPVAVLTIADRRQALAHVIASASANDVVLVAGKGHEDYQQVGEQRLPYSDRDTVDQLLREAA